MAGFLEKFGQKVANVVGEASDAMGDFAQETKLKTEIKKFDEVIKGVKAKFGVDAVEARLSGEDDSVILAKLDEACRKIREVEADISRLQVDLAKIKEDKASSSSKTAEGDKKDL